MASTLTFSDQLVVEVCWCGIYHAVPRQLREHQLRQFNNGEKPQSIYCPLGHAWIPSGTPEVEKVRKRLEREEARAASLVAELDQERASHRSTKGQLTKTKKRVANGVCPCCHRSFVQLARHMKGQHPDYVE